VSFFHHYRHIVGYEGTFEDFTEAFLNDQIIYAPFNDHVLDFWNLRDEPNVLFLFYEDMKFNMDGVVKKAMKFMGKTFSQLQIDELCMHLSVDSMRKNPTCNNDGLVEKAKSLNKNGKSSGSFKFIRKGEVGSFRDEFSNALDQKFDNFMRVPALQSTNFSFKLQCDEIIS
jgi:Sulfotransferase domain